MKIYTIEQREPEGWLKAFAVICEGEVVSYHSYYDNAEYYIRRQQEREHEKLMMSED